MRRPVRKHSTVPPRPPDDSLTKKVKNLPLFGPGIVISIPLHLWPTYRMMNGLEVLGPKQMAWLAQHGVPKRDGVLYVQRAPKTAEIVDEQGKDR